MKKIVKNSWAQENASFTIEEAIHDKIHSQSDLVRSNAIIFIGLNMNGHYSKVLLKERGK